MILFIVCCAALVKAQKDDDIDESIYDQILNIFNSKHPKDSELASCLTDYYRRNRIVDRFYTRQLLSDNAKLEEELKPYIPKAESNCKPDIDPNEKDGEKNNENDKKNGNEKSEDNNKSDDSGSFFSTPWGIATIVGIVAVAVAIAGFVGKMFLTKSRGQRIPTSDGP